MSEGSDTSLGDKQQVLESPPHLTDDSEIDTLLKTRLHIESTLHAVRAQLLSPPEDGVTLLHDVVHNTVDDNTRLLEYYSQMEEGLDSKLQGLNRALISCRKIEEQLISETEPDDHAAETARLQNLILDSQSTFRAFKVVFTQFLDELQDTHKELNISGVLQALCTAMVNTPQDPYIEMDAFGCSDAALLSLQQLNLVQVHPQCHTKIRLLDPRMQ